MQDLRYAIRQLRAYPAFTSIVVASLAVGIGVNTAIFSLIDEVLLSRLPDKNPNELVMLGWGGDQWPRDLNQSGSYSPDASGYRVGSYSLAYPFFEQVQAHVGSGAVLTSVFGFAPLGTSRENTTVSIDGDAARADVEMIAGDYFGGLGIAPLVGRALTGEDTRGQVAAAVIS